MRWTQKVHFSITPRGRTVTSGLYTRRVASGVAPVKSRKLNRRTLNGQLFAQ